ncbi:MAG: hypothetical protein Q4G00_03845 [Clostridia bacterium]|nr:hypothetical protein [Clostridia bacterium]
MSDTLHADLRDREDSLAGHNPGAKTFVGGKNRSYGFRSQFPCPPEVSREPQYSFHFLGWGRKDESMPDEITMLSLHLGQLFHASAIAKYFTACYNQINKKKRMCWHERK